MVMFSVWIAKASTNEIIVQPRIPLAGHFINPPTKLSIIGNPIYSLRSTLIQNIWSGNGFPMAGANVVSNNVPTPYLNGPMPTNLLHSDSYTFVLKDNSGTPIWTNLVYSFVPTNSGTRLVIYHAGHDGYIPIYYTQPDYQEIPGYNSGDLVRKLVENGYTVVSIAMPFLQQGHSGYLPTPNGTINHLRFFVEPTIRIINQFTNATKVFMTGISGGGWTTTLVAALDTRITVSAPTAGSLPFYIVPQPRDWEQFLPGLPVTCDYTNLYVMAADRPGRVQTQFLNSNDGCCFSGVDALANIDYTVNTIARASSYGGTWSRYITINWNHSFDIDVQTNIVNLFNAH